MSRIIIKWWKKLTHLKKNLIKKTGKKVKKKKIRNEDGDIEELKEIVEDIPTEYDEETGEKKPKVKRYINNKGKIIKLEEEEPSEEEPSEEIEKKVKISKKKKKDKKPKVMLTKDGEEVQVIDDENEPSEEVIDKRTGKRKPKKKKIINKDGEIEDI